MREMTPIVVGMTEPHPCERVSSFLGKSSLMHSVSWIRSLQLFLLERRANWNVLEILNDFFGACVSAFFSIFFYDVGLLEVERSFILHMVSMVFLLCSYGEPSYVIKWICQYCSWCSWSSKWCLQLCFRCSIRASPSGLATCLVNVILAKKSFHVFNLVPRACAVHAITSCSLSPRKILLIMTKVCLVCLWITLLRQKLFMTFLVCFLSFWATQSWASHSFVLLVWSLSCYCEELGSSWLCSCFFFLFVCLATMGSQVPHGFLCLGFLVACLSFSFCLVAMGRV